MCDDSPLTGLFIFYSVWTIVSSVEALQLKHKACVNCIYRQGKAVDQCHCCDPTCQMAFSLCVVLFFGVMKKSLKVHCCVKRHIPGSGNACYYRDVLNGRILSRPVLLHPAPV